MLGCTGTVIGAAPSSNVAEALAGVYEKLDRTKKKIKDGQNVDKAGLKSNADREQRIRKNLEASADRFRALYSQIGGLQARAVRPASTTTAKPKKKPKVVTLAAASYQIPRGSKATLKLPLSKGAKAIVKRHGYLVLRRVVVAVGPTGRQTLKAKTIVLKVKKAKTPAKKK